MSKRSRQPSVEGPAATTKTCLLVVGMHRSGTSALTRTLGLKGCDLPNTLLEGSETNERGHWESQPVNKLNDEVFTAAGTTWRDCQPVNPAWYASDEAAALRARAVEVLQSEFGDSALFALKDPRVCKLLPFWIDVLRAFGAEPRIVTMVRSPTEVAASLARRNGLDTSYGEVLWLSYVLEGEIASRGLPRITMTYDKLLGDWRGVVDDIASALSVTWPRGDEAGAEIDAFLSPELRHHSVSDDGALPQWVGETYAIMRDWSRDGETAEGRAKLDQLAADYAGAMPTVGKPLYVSAESLRRASKLKTLNNDLKNEVAALKDAAASAAESEKKAVELAGRLQEVERKSADTAEAATAIAKRDHRNRQEIERQQAEIGQRVAELKDLRRQLDEANGRAGKTDEDLARLTADAERNIGAIAKLRQRLSDHEANAAQHAELRERLGRTELELTLRVREAEGHVVQLAEARTRLVERENEFTRRIVLAERQLEELATARANLAKLETELALKTVAAERSALEASEIRGRYVQLQDELTRVGERNQKQGDQLAVVRLKLDRATSEVHDVKGALARERTELQGALDRERAELEAVRAQLEEANRKSLGKTLRRLKAAGGRLARKPMRLIRPNYDPVAARQHKEDMALVGASKLFDGPWYLKQNPDVVAGKLDPLHHFVRHGGGEGRDPSTGFDSAGYLEVYGEVREAGLNPLTHYLRYGQAEGRSPRPRDGRPAPLPKTKPGAKTAAVAAAAPSAPAIAAPDAPPPVDETAVLILDSGFFDPKWYLTRYPQVAEGKHDPLVHYMTKGAWEGFNPGPRFDSQAYLDAHADVRASSINPLLHFLTCGRAEGRAAIIPPRHGLMVAARAEGVGGLSQFSPSARVVWVRGVDLAPRDGVDALVLRGKPLALASAGFKGEAAARTARIFGRLSGWDSDTTLGAANAAGKVVTVREGKSASDRQPVLDPDFANGGLTIADAWFTNDEGLRLRVSAEQAEHLVLRAFQAADGQLVAVGEALALEEGPSFVDLALANPYAPVLLAATTIDGLFAGLTLLPYPSLCRGGAHAGELPAVGASGGYLAELRAVSSGLVEEHLGWTNAPAFSVAAVEIDLEGALGSERIFSGPLRTWLSDVIGVAVRPAASDRADPALDSLRAKLTGPAGPAATAREAQGSVVLTLPADGLPTLGALVSRRLAAPADAGVAVGSFVVASGVSGKPKWFVSLPPLNGHLLSLQPRGAAVGFPTLRAKTAAPGATPAAFSEVAPLPLAIRHHDLPINHEASLLAPRSLDAEGAILRRELTKAERKAATVSVLLISRDGAGAALLASLSRQTVAESIDVVVVADDQAALRADLEALFPGRHTLLAASDAPSSAAINQAAAAAKGRYLLLADDRMVLSDPRTLETLVTMAVDKGVATASCMIVRETGFRKGTIVRRHSAGLYPTHVSFLSAPRLMFKEIDSAAAFPLATYPVAGNSLRLALVRADAWKTLNGLDAERFPNHHGDLDFAVRATAAGLVHLCTSAVAAADLSDVATAEHIDAVSLNFLTPQRWQDLFSSVAVLRELL